MYEYMIWVVSTILPLIIISAITFVWMKTTKLDPAIPSLVGILLFILYIGFLLGLLCCSCIGG